MLEQCRGKLSTHWEERYSSAEMIYLEVTERDVRSYLSSGSEDRADHWSFADVMAGAIDGDVGNIFGQETLAELKAAVQARIETSSPGGLPPKV